MFRKCFAAQFVVLAFALVFALFMVGCGGGTSSPALSTPPASASPPPAAPTASLSANPGTITQGGSSMLTWQTANATTITIDALGTVAASGSESVAPTATTTYILTAKGAGGTQTATATITVNAPAPPPPPPPTPPTPPAPPTTLAASYIFAILPPLPGGSDSQALVINSSGEAAGYSMVNGLAEATKWVNGQPVDLGPGYVLAINDNGEMAGIVVGPGGMNEAAHWLRDSPVSITVGLLDGFDSIVANGIDEDGTVTGTAFNSFDNSQMEGFEWTAEGGLVAVPQLIESFAIRNGTMAGLSPTFEASTAVLSPTVTSSTDLGVSGDALAINSQGDVAGFTFGNVDQAFIWKQGQLRLLGTGGALGSTALNVNTSDLIVGYLSQPDGMLRSRAVGLKRKLINPSVGSGTAIGWSATEGIVQLASRVEGAESWVLNYADDINDSGQIVGTASMTTPDGTITTTGFILNPQ